MAGPELAAPARPDGGGSIINEYSRPGDGSKDLRGMKSFPFREGAGYYRTLGWTGTIPVARQGTKAPLVKGVTGHNGKDVDDGELRRLIRQYPQANLGLRLPWNIIGIDVDAYEGRQGSATIIDLARRLGCHLPLTWRSTSRAPEDGVSGIYLFHAPRTARRVWVTDLGPGSGVEIAQYHHRFATVAPSVHNSTGRVYKWWYGDGRVEAPMPSDLPELPVPWWQYLMSSRDYAIAKQAQGPEVLGWYARVGPGAMCTWMSQSAEREAAKVRVAGALGGLHDTLCQAVTHLCMNAAEGHLGLEQALGIIEYDFSHAGRRRNMRSEWAGAVNTAMANAAAIPQEEIDVCSMASADWRKIT